MKRPPGLTDAEWEAAQSVREALSAQRRREGAKQAAATRKRRWLASPPVHVTFRFTAVRSALRGTRQITFSSPHGGWRQARSMAAAHGILRCTDCRDPDCVTFWSTGVGCRGSEFVD